MLHSPKESYYSQEKSKTAIDPSILPLSFYSAVAEYPELHQLLTAFAHRDQATFLHSVAVHFNATQLAHNLFLLFSQSKTNFREGNDTQQVARNWLKQLKPLSIFWLLHDIGKTASSLDLQDYSIAQNRVHPVFGKKRPSLDTGMHYLHPQQSGHLINIWAQSLSNSSSKKTEKLKPLAQIWAKLSYLHDKRINVFSTFDTSTLPTIEKHALLLFSASDTSVAMGLPRPNKFDIESNSKIREIIWRDHISQPVLKQLFPNFDSISLQNYIFASITQSIQTLRTHFTDELLTAQNMSPNFATTAILDQIIATAWKTYEKDWDQTLLKMDKARVL